MVMLNYVFIGFLMMGAVGFAVAPLILERLIAPRKRGRSKGETYECGVLTTGETWIRFRIQYFIYALLFVVFDIETVLKASRDFPLGPHHISDDAGKNPEKADHQP